MERFKAAGNVVFCGIVLVFLMVTLGNLCAMWLIDDYNLPTRSTLEGRNYQKEPDFSLDKIAAGKTQTQLEKYVSDRVPLRNDVLRIHAAVERTIIAAANVPFGYPAYSTFYGSNYVYLPDYASVLQRPALHSEEFDAQLSAAEAAWNALISSRPDINWVFYFADRANISTGSPVYGLVRNTITYQDYQRGVLDSLKGVCDVVDGAVTDTGEFYRLRFKTDHHWTIQAATEAYQAIAPLFGKTPITVEGYDLAFAGPFYGSFARSGCCFPEGVWDSIDDVVYQPSNLSVRINGEDKEPSDIDKHLFGDAYEPEDMYDNIYAKLFHGDPKVIVITNDDNKKGGNLAIIGDSFSNNCEKLYAELYHKVYVLDPRDFDEDHTIAAYLENHGIDDVLVLCSSTVIASEDVVKSLI